MTASASWGSGPGALRISLKASSDSLTAATGAPAGLALAPPGASQSTANSMSVKQMPCSTDLQREWLVSHLMQTVSALQHSLQVQSLHHLRLAELIALHLTALAQVLHLTLVRTARLGVCHCTAQPQRLQFLGLALLELDVFAFNLTRAPRPVTSGGCPSASQNCVQVL